MAKVSGKRIYVEFDGVSLMASGREFAVSKVQNTANSTAGADEYENTILTTKKLSATLKMVMIEKATGGAAIAEKIKLGHTGNLVWGLEGNAAGKPKGGFFGHLVKADVSAPYDNVVTIDAAWEMADDDILFDESVAVW
ncbi:MAG: hypothetical protein MUF38_05750 [Anaerolineae bacterium]|jgi:hypothetical protein|nr:hypothetical protein [Anaerolineae bacterium]